MNLAPNDTFIIYTLCDLIGHGCSVNSVYESKQLIETSAL